MQLTAIEFQTKCLEIMDQIMENHEEVIITKYGKPVVKLVSVEEEVPCSFGYMKGSVKINGDIIAPIDEVWDVDDQKIINYAHEGYVKIVGQDRK